MYRIYTHIGKPRIREQIFVFAAADVIPKLICIFNRAAPEIVIAHHSPYKTHIALIENYLIVFVIYTR